MGESHAAPTKDMSRGSCFFSLTSRALAYRTKPLCQQAGNPLVVFGDAYVTQEKVELVLMVESSPDEFVVKSVHGEQWFVIERKDIRNWDSRVIRSFLGDPICCIQKNKYPQVEGFSIISLASDDLEPIIGLEAKNKKSSNKKMYANLAMDDNIGERTLLKISGDLKSRMYGIVWNEVGKKDGPMVSMTWDVCVDGGAQDRGCARYVMEIPAGVDAACIVAIATAICERDAPDREHAILPLEPQHHNEIRAFGSRFMAKTMMSLIMSARDIRLDVIDGAGCIRLSMDALGVCKAPSGENVFQLSQDGMSIQGVTDGKGVIDITFSTIGHKGSAAYLLALVSSDLDRRNQVVLVAPIQPTVENATLPVRRLQHLDEQTGEPVMTGPVIARIVMSVAGSHHFDIWYRNAKSRTPSTALPSSPPGLGIGADISGGVDFGVITAMMLMMIKVSPAAKKMRAIFGSIKESTSPVPHKGISKELKPRKYVVHEKHGQNDIAGIVKQFEGLL